MNPLFPFGMPTAKSAGWINVVPLYRITEYAVVRFETSRVSKAEELQPSIDVQRTYNRFDQHRLLRPMSQLLVCDGIVRIATGILLRGRVKVADTKMNSRSDYSQINF